MTERPWQLEQAEAWEALRDELVTLEVMEWFYNQNQAHDWFAYWKPLAGRYEPGASCLEAVERDGDELGRASQANAAGAVTQSCRALPPGAAPV